MKRLTMVIALLMSFIFIAPMAVAAMAEVTWIKPDKYRDIRAGEENRKRFEARVLKSLEGHLVKLAEKLPADQVLKIDVTDLDLAGDVWLNVREIRIVEDLYFPSMAFSYQLLNAEQAVVKEDQVKLKDMSFLTTSNLRYRNKAFGYEKKMLDDWFKDTFSDHLVEK